MKRKLFYFLALTIISGIFSISGFSQDLRATAFEVKNADKYDGGKLFITVNDQQKMIAEQANDAWLINDGREVVYSGRDGAGGYEGEGQSLKIYEVSTGKTRKIMSQYYMIMGLSELKLKNGQLALLVRMEDGGLGASYFSVVDPKRGEVFFESFAEMTSTQGDMIKLSFYEHDDWDAIIQGRDVSYYNHKDALPPSKAKVKPSRTAAYDLNKLLKNKVISRKTTMEILDAGLKYVKLYLWRPNDQEPNKDFVLGTVDRQVSSTAPLRPTLEELFEGPNADEVEKVFDSPTFGMKFEGVVLKDGVATVKFSQPPDKRNHGTMAPLIMQEAIEKTVKQFPSVKQVKVCAIGETFIDNDLEKPFPKCK